MDDNINEVPIGRGRARRKSMLTTTLRSEDEDNMEPIGRTRTRGRAVSKPLPQEPGRLPVLETRSMYSPAAGEDCRLEASLSKVESPSKGRSRTSSISSGTSYNVEKMEKRLAAVNISAERKRSQKQKNKIESTVWTKPRELETKKGTTGQQISLNANYFRLPTVTKWQLYQYRVDFEPEEDRKAVKSRMLREHKEIFGGYIFDGTMLFSPRRYHPDPMEFFTHRQSDKATVRITVRTVGVPCIWDYQYVHFFNLLLRRCLDCLKLQLVGRHYFDSSARIAVDKHRLELWPGYVTSIRQHEKELLLCTEIVHKVMRQDTVYTLLQECCSHDATGGKKKFKQTILGSIVLTDYNNKTYRVDDVDFSVTPLSTFDCRGDNVSYMEYFYQKYEMRIKDKYQPMLVTMPKQRDRRGGQTSPIYLVPELCRMTGLSDQMRTNFMLMKDLADCTRLGPSQRIERLQHFNRSLNTNRMIAEELKSWNMEMSESLVTLSGRILPPERVILGRNVKCESGVMNDWTKELRLHPMLVTREVDSWLVVVPSQLLHDTTKFVSTLRASAYKMELHLPDPHYRELSDDRMASYVEALEGGMLSFNPKLILVILPNNRLDRYSAIKKKCCVDRAVPTQLILQKNLINRSVTSIATKVAIQMNCKIGGAPWTIEIPLQGLMVVGFDVYHDTLQKGLSIGALVASLDKPMSRYFSAVSHHRTGEELSNELSANICKSLQKYAEYNHGCLPQRIVIYRDGVGEGQIPYVFEHEVAILRAKLAQVYAEQQYRMAFIIVTKRINTRLFYNGTNPPPGTVVDDTITMPERYDFFLVSQSVRQGTVSPTSYNVISDNLGLDPDKLQRLTYKLTHLYFNWSGTVRVPAPCQYAHKLAYLVGQALHRAPSSRLEDVLYFL